MRFEVCIKVYRKIIRPFLLVLIFMALPPAVLCHAQGGGALQGGQGGGSQGGSEARDFGDMIILYRDGNGVPIISDPVQAIDPESGELVDAGLCQQPMAAAGVTVVNTLTGETACVPASPTESCLIPVDPFSCSLVEGYEIYEQPVELSRINVDRAPSAVMDRQLEDLLETLGSAQCITLDPAGRLVVTVPDTMDSDGDGDTTEPVSKAVDSPIQNLVIYREMMEKGYLGDQDSPVSLPAPNIQNYGFLDTAAKGLGAAADKEGKIDMNVVVYLNQILGLSMKNSVTQLPKICVNFRKEVKGEMESVEKCFLDYGQYGYGRQGLFSQLPFPAYIPKSAPVQGAFEYLTIHEGASGPGGTPLFQISNASIGPTVFPDGSDPGNMDPGFTGGNIRGFAQAADDTRAVIKFMHDHPVLAGYETEVSCGGSGTGP